MKKYRFSAVSIAQHELFRELRRIHKLGIHKDVFEKILLQRDSTKKAFSAMLVLGILLVMWISSSPVKNLKIKLQFLEVKFEKIYVIFAACLIFSLAYIMIFSFFVLQQAVLKFLRMKYGDGFNYANIIYEGESAWSLSFIQKFSFIKTGRSRSIVSIFGYFLYILPLITMIISMYIVLFVQSINNIWLNNFISFNFLVSFSSICFLLFCFVYLVHSLYPYRFHKNLLFIRWGLLFRISQKVGTTPARMNFWLENKNSATMDSKGS